MGRTSTDYTTSAVIPTKPDPPLKTGYRGCKTSFVCMYIHPPEAKQPESKSGTKSDITDTEGWTCDQAGIFYFLAFSRYMLCVCTYFVLIAKLQIEYIGLHIVQHSVFVT